MLLARNGSIAMKPTSASPLPSASTDLAAVSNCSKLAGTPSSRASSRARSIDTPAGFSLAVRLWASTGLPMLSEARSTPVGANCWTRERVTFIAVLEFLSS